MERRRVAHLVRDYVIEHLADADAVLVIDETGFLKQGKASCGVARQYTGSAGKITNRQIGVFAAYVSRHGHASSIARSICRRAGVTIGFASGPLMVQTISASPPSPGSPSR